MNDPMLGGLRFCLFALVISLASGCAVSPEFREQSLPRAIQLETNQGLVAVAITSNRGSTSAFFAKWAAIRFRNTTTGETFDAIDKSDSSALLSVYVRPLPPGTYEVDGVSNTATGWLTIRAGASAKDHLPTFRVESSRLTDLGTLVYFRQHFPVNTRRYVWGLVESTDHEWILKQLSPALSAQLRSRPTLGWDVGDLLSTRKQIAVDLRRQSARQIVGIAAPAGAYYFGESLGQIAVRASDGSWRWIDTGTTVPIRALYLHGARLFAGGDSGTLLVSEPGQKRWSPLKAPTMDGTIFYIGKAPATESLLVAIQERNEFVVYTTPINEPGSWTESLRRPRKIYLNPAQDAYGRVVANDSWVMLLTGSGEASLEVSSLNLDGKGWITKVPGGIGSGEPYSLTSKGELVAFRGIPLTGMNYSVSTDLGATWQRRGELNWIRALTLASDTVAYAMRLDVIPAFDEEEAKYSLWRTDDAGKTWKNVGPLPGVSARLFVLGGTEALGLATGNGRFYSSNDGGASWKVERELP